MSDSVWASSVAWVVYLIAGVIYRLYFHPLAQFPGPKLAAATGWYEFYHDIVKRGCFIWKIQELHDKYGTYLTQFLSHPIPIGNLAVPVSRSDTGSYDVTENNRC